MKINNLIIIGSSAGGPKALHELFADMPRLNATVVVIQHMPNYISKSLAQNLNNQGDMACSLIQDNDPLANGNIHVVPGDLHANINSNQRFELFDGQPVNYVKPAIDVTMKSISKNEFKNICAVILTGMGSDGVLGIEHLKALGAVTIAQNKESCAVFGMPKRAIESGHIDHVLSIDQIQKKLIQLFYS